MGFCRRCGEIASGRCNRCGGRPTEASISCLVSGGSETMSIVEKWQSQYLNTILAPEEVINSKQNTTDAAKPIAVAQSSFYNPPFYYSNNSKTAVCTCCSKMLEKGVSPIMEDLLPYCKDCHFKLFNKRECPECLQTVSRKESFIEYGKRAWHTSCFVCFGCKTILDSDPLVDLKNRPCCESCFMSQQGSHQSADQKPTVTNVTATTTPIRTRTPTDRSYSPMSSGSRISNKTSLYQSPSSYTSNNRRSRIDRELSQQPPLPSLTRTPSPENHEEEEEDRRHESLLSKRLEKSMHISPQPSFPFHKPSPSESRSRPFIPKPKPSNMANSLLTSTSSVATSQPPVTSNSIKSISSQPCCHHCKKQLGDSVQKKIKIALSSAPTGYAWFHKDCFRCSKCRLGFEKSEECATDGVSFYHAYCGSSLPTGGVDNSIRRCEECKKPVLQDSLRFNEKSYHFACFKCQGNGCQNNLIQLGQPVFEIHEKPYCQSCHTLISTHQQVATSQKSSCGDNSSPITRPTRTFPKLGGSKSCPRCKLAVSIQDDIQGPLASRWHKRCLCCAKCLKQLDSAAKVTPDANGESLVYCRNCL